jgi:hypothetical protein
LNSRPEHTIDLKGEAVARCASVTGTKYVCGIANRNEIARRDTMDAQPSEARTQATLAEATKLKQPRETPKPAPTRLPAIFVGAVIAIIAGLSIWYLVRPVPLLVQGEVDATRLDIAARVDGRVAS